MPVAIAVIIGVAVMATALIGLVWAILFLLPYYAYVAAAAYLIWRSNRKYADLSAAVDRDAARQRQFNDQETRAWRSSLENETQRSSRRERVLRRFDRDRAAD